MRFTIPAINNDYYDEDYLRVFGFKSLGKNIRVHRSVVFMKPANVSIADDVTIMPYCVFGPGKTDVVIDVEPFFYSPGTTEESPVDAEKRIKELEALLEAKDRAGILAQAKERETAEKKAALEQAKQEAMKHGR